MSIDGVESDLRRLNIRKAALTAQRREQTAALKVLDDQLANAPSTMNNAQMSAIRHATSVLLSALRTSEREMELLNETERRLKAEHTFWQKNKAN